MKRLLNNILLILGILLLASAIAFAVYSHISQNNSAIASKQLVDEIYSIIPEPYGAFPDDQANKAMPTVEINDMNFAGIIEVPLYESVLPVYSQWDPSKTSQFPCRYMGSVYDGTLVIGGSDNKEQLDFMKLISIGDSVYITDMTGARFAYTVSDIKITKDASTESLTDTEADLTFFAPNSTSFDYTVIYCDMIG